MTEFASGTLTGKNLHLSFGHNHVLRGIDLHVEKGTTASVIGPSGSGKSTLLRVMNRLIEPDQGDILLDGRRGNHLGGLMQSGVDHFHAGVTERCRHHLGATIMAIKPGLRHEHANRSSHR